MNSEKEIISKILTDRINSLADRAEERKKIAEDMFNKYKENWKDFYKLGSYRPNSINLEIQQLKELAWEDWKDSVRLNFILIDMIQRETYPESLYEEMFRLLANDRDLDIKNLKDKERETFFNNREQLIAKIVEGCISVADAIIEYNCNKLGVTLESNKTSSAKKTTKI